MKEFAIGANLEGAPARWDQRERLYALAELKNFGRQTDGPRRVVSDDAIFDRHLGFHQRASPFRGEAIGATQCGQESQRRSMSVESPILRANDCELKPALRHRLPGSARQVPTGTKLPPIVA